MPARAAVKTDAISLLKADHRAVEELFEQFENSKSASKKQALAQKICLELSVHTRIEEEIFYPACKEHVEEDLLNEAYVEHDGAKVLISELAAGRAEDDFYDAKMSVLSEQIKHHVEEEEKRAEGLFAQAKEAGLDMQELGDRMAKRKKELLAEYKADGIPELETRSFSGHSLTQGLPIENTASA
jgi:hypothetical protein